MMNFASPEETMLAAILTARYLPVFLRSFEDGLERLGLKIVERSQFLDKTGKACPLIVVQGKRLRLRLELRNAMEELLTLDREERPVTIDVRLQEDAYARWKIADIVDGRLAILKAIDESQDVLEAQRRVGELAGRFEWLKAVFEEGR